MQLKKLILGTSALIGVGLLGYVGGERGVGSRGHARWRARPRRSRASRGPRRSAASRTTRARRQLWRAASTSATTPRSTSSPAARTRRPASSTARRSSSRPTPTARSTPTRPGCSCAAAGASSGWATRTAWSTTASVGGQTIAAGTGGIDGSDAVITAAPLVFLANSNDATKIRYYTPSFGGFSLGVSLHADPAGRSTAARTTARTSPARTASDAMEAQEHRRGRAGL